VMRSFAIRCSTASTACWLDMVASVSRRNVYGEWLSLAT